MELVVGRDDVPLVVGDCDVTLDVGDGEGRADELVGEPAGGVKDIS